MQNNFTPFSLDCKRKGGTVKILPILHNVLEFAEIVHKSILLFRPTTVLVELPEELEYELKKGVSLLPSISTITYKPEGVKKQSFITIEPTDPLVEAVRTCLQKDIPCIFADLLVRNYGCYVDIVPDPYIVSSQGLKTYFDLYNQLNKQSILKDSKDNEPTTDNQLSSEEYSEDCSLDEKREEHMAFSAFSAAEKIPQDQCVLLVCGMHHALRIKNILEARSFKEHTSPELDSVSIWAPTANSLRQISQEMPFINMLYEYWRSNTPISLKDKTESNKRQKDEHMADNLLNSVSFDDTNEDKKTTPKDNSKDSSHSFPKQIKKLKDDIAKLSHILLALRKKLILGNRYSKYLLDNVIKVDEEKANLSEEELDDYLESPEVKKTLFRMLQKKRLEIEEAENSQENTNQKLDSDFDSEDNKIDDSNDSNSNGLKTEEREQIKFATYLKVSDRLDELRDLCEVFISEISGSVLFDRQKIIKLLFDTAIKNYENNTGDTIKTWQKRTLVQFLGNYCKLGNYLLPNLYDCVIGAKAVSDDNFGYEVWDLASFYPWYDSLLPQIELTAQDMLSFNSKTMYFRRKYPNYGSLVKKYMEHTILGDNAENTNGKDWAEDTAFNLSYQNCTYPPEDIVLDSYVTNLSKRAVGLISSKKQRIEEFSTSMLDGIAIKETIRNYHIDKKLYVYENQTSKEQISSVVIIFDHQKNDNRYDWMQTWNGEDYEDYDLAYYSTHPNMNIIAPGIGRSEYGGLLLSSPKNRLHDIWNDNIINYHTKSKADVLLCAAIYYSVDKHILYCAKEPPRAKICSFAEKVGKKIIYLPLGQLSPIALRKIRILHILENFSVREICKKYLF